jgi:hypothetical protein
MQEHTLSVEFGVSHHARRYAERAREPGAEENIGTERAKVENIHDRLLQNIFRMIKSGMGEKVVALAGMR